MLGAQGLGGGKQMDSFEQIGLALGVATVQNRPPRFQRQVQAGEVAKVFQDEAVQQHNVIIGREGSEKPSAGLADPVLADFAFGVEDIHAAPRLLEEAVQLLF